MIIEVICKKKQKFNLRTFSEETQLTVALFGVNDDFVSNF